jgi:hypothetical protein
MYEIIY